MIYAVMLDRSEAGHVLPVANVLEQMGREVVVITGLPDRKPSPTDVILCVGDRYQLLKWLIDWAPASRICQLHANERTTSVAEDYRYRHAIGALATVRMTATIEAFERGGGKDPLVGSPCLSGAAMHTTEAARMPPFNGIDYVVFAMNGCKGCGAREIRGAYMAVATAARNRGWRVYTTVPNHEFEFKIQLDEPNTILSDGYGVDHPEFQRIVAGARLMIGNSSAGIIEAPSLHTQTIDIIPRQNGRLLASSILRSESNALDDMDMLFNAALKLNFDNRPYDTIDFPDIRAAVIVAAEEDRQ